MPLAADAERTRLMALQRAKSPGRALRSVRRRLGGLLPIDVLTTHYPDRHGCVRLNLTLSRTARTAIRRAAALRGQRPQDFLSHSVTTAVARHQQQRAQHLAAHLERTLAHHTPAEVLAGIGTLLGRRVPPSP
ncbi:hypothetical protein [Streptomyces sp. NPDC055036]